MSNPNPCREGTYGLVGTYTMGQFDNLPGVFYLAKLHRCQENVMLTYDEYTQYLALWNELNENDQRICIENARK